MNTKSTIIVVVIIVLVILLGWWIYASNNHSAQNDENTSGANGQVMVSVTDAAANIEGVNEVTMTVNKAELYSQAHGWVTVDSSSKEIKLLTLRNQAKAELYAQANVPSDTYSKVRVMASKVEVQAKNGAKTVAKLPNEQMEFDANVVVNEGKTTEAKFDFLVDKSLHTTAKGEYVFAPVVKFESRTDATVNVTSDNTVESSGGNLEGSAMVGMDLDGSMKANFELNTNTNLKIENGIIINGLLNATSSTNSGASTNLNVNGSSKVNLSGSANAGADSSGTSMSGSGSGSVNVQLQ